MFWAEDKFRTVFNREAFTDFTREEDSYFFGLLLADGNVAKDRARIKLVLQRRDRSILERFQEYLKCSVPIKDILQSGKYEASSLVFSSKELKERLVSQNLLPAKSGNEMLPNFDWENNHHFWRGVVDGDGSLFYTSTSKPMFSLIGSKQLLTGFGKFVENKTGIPCKRMNPNTVSTKVFNIVYSGFEAVIVTKLLYESSTISLDRKYSLYEDFCKYKRSNNTSGKVGVSFCKPKNKFTANISVDGKKISLGNFANYEEAVAAREAAELKYFGRLKGN